MATSALLPIVGVAAASLAREAASAVGSGLSFAAELMRQGRGVGAETSQAQSELDSFRERFTAALSQFSRRLKQHLTAAGLVVSGPIELAADGLGGIEVGGNHPQRGSIESLLAADESLREQFTSLAEGFELLSDGGRRHEFGLLIDGDEAEVLVR